MDTLTKDVAVLVGDDQRQIESARTDSGKIVSRAVELARAICDAASLGAAADYLLEIKRKRKWWADWNKPSKQKLDALKKELLAREREIDEPMERAENEILKPAMIQYEMAEEQKRREQEAILREEARKHEEDARMRDAAMLEKDGHTDLAQAVMDAPVMVPAQVVPKVEMPAGISYREVWRYRVVNPELVPREYLVIDDKKIGGVVRALKGETRIAGVEIYAEKTVTGRA